MSRVVLLRVLATLHDIGVAVAALPLAYLIRTGDLPPFEGGFLVLFVIFVGLAPVMAFAVGLNRGSWRYASISDLGGIIASAIITTAISTLAAFLFTRLVNVPGSVPVLALGLMVMMMGGPRLMFRLFKERHTRVKSGSARGVSSEPVLLYGYCDGASNFIRALARERNPSYHVLGIIDHSGRHVGRHMHRVPVLGTLADLGSIVTRFAHRGLPVGKLILAPARLKDEVIAGILEAASEHGIVTYRLPNLVELDAAGSGTRDLNPRALRVEDLLERDDITLNLESVARLIRGRRVLITGAGGSIGSELVRQIASFNPEWMTLVESSEFNLYQIDRQLACTAAAGSFSSVLCDVRQSAHVHAVFTRERPDIIFHAAALKHVPLLEANALQGIHTNVLGTQIVADAAIASGCKAFVLISTDKAVNPTNIMGATKRFAEAYCQTLDSASGTTRFLTVRFGNVLGSTGSVVPLFASQIARGGPVTVTHPDIERYFMTIPEAVRLVLATSAKGLEPGAERCGIYVLDMGKPVRIADLASRMIQLSGLRPHVDIKIQFTGLRPGEKLFEELFEAGEEELVTGDPWLRVARTRVVDGASVRQMIDRCRTAVETLDEGVALEALAKIVPELRRTRGHRAITVEAAGLTEGGEASLISIEDARRRRAK
jgi:FlaA1/EpsC-like NDP-sugar epimerase